MKTRQKPTIDKEEKRYRLVLSNEHTHEQLWFLNVTKAGMCILGISTLFVIAALVYVIVAYTPIRTFIPGYPDAYSKSAAIQNAIKVDSLETVIMKWELYSENLKRVLTGTETIKLDSIVNLDSTSRLKAKQDMSRDSVLRQIVREEEKFDVGGNAKRLLPIEGIHFFTPLKGMVSQGYDHVIHPYIDITAPKNAVVMATLDGTVIFSGWSDESGYMIQIQHENDIISIYKHNSKLLKKVGEKVTAGTPIALVGNTGALTTGDHLHFELWYKGEAVNPEQYIKF